MRIGPPRDQPLPSGEDDALRHVEEAARVSSAMHKGLVRQKGEEHGETPARTFAEQLERAANDSSAPLDDPDSDTWTQEVIGSRIHWQYGPDGKRKPLFRHQTRRLDDMADGSTP